MSTSERTLRSTFGANLPCFLAAEALINGAKINILAMSHLTMAGQRHHAHAIHHRHPLPRRRWQDGFHAACACRCIQAPAQLQRGMGGGKVRCQPSQRLLQYCHVLGLYQGMCYSWQSLASYNSKRWIAHGSITALSPSTQPIKNCHRSLTTAASR